MHQFIDHYINIALKREETKDCQNLNNQPNGEIDIRRQSLIEDLAKQTSDVPKIRSQILQGLMAMQDTTSTLVSNTLFLLSRNPGLWHRLRQEVKDLNFQVSTVKALREIVLLQNILKECTNPTNFD